MIIKMENSTLKYELKGLLKDNFNYDYLTYNSKYYLILTGRKMLIDQTDINEVINKISAMGFCLTKSEIQYGFKVLIFQEMIE